MTCLLTALRNTDISVTYNNDNNNNDFFCANILEDQALWRDRTKGLTKLVIVN